MIHADAGTPCGVNPRVSYGHSNPREAYSSNEPAPAVYLPTHPKSIGLDFSNMGPFSKKEGWWKKIKFKFSFNFKSAKSTDKTVERRIAYEESVPE